MKTTSFLRSKVPLGPWTAWYSYRRKRFWILLALLLYTLAGFLLVPWIINKQLTSLVEEDLQLQLSVGKTRINPWTLTAEIQDFALSEPDGDQLLGFRRLFINFQTVSLFKWAFTFRDVILEEPSAAIALDADGSLNLQQLVPPTETEAAPAVEPQNPEDPEEPDAAPLRWLIHNLAITQGQVMFRDENRETPFSVNLGPIDISLTDLNTLPELPGDQTVFLAAENDTSIEWSGDIQLNPFRSAGHLEASGAYLQLAHDYFRSMLNFTVEEAALTLGLDYSIDAAETGLTAAVSNATLEINNLHLDQNSPENTPEDLVTLSSLTLEGASYSWPDNALAITSIGLDTVFLNLWRTPEVPVNLVQLVTVEPGEEEAASGADGSPFTVRLDTFSINGLSADFIDYVLNDQARIEVRDLDLDVSEISNEDGAEFPLMLSHRFSAGGLMSTQGTVSVLPDLALELESTAENVPLTILQPWIAPFIRLVIDNGVLNHDFHISISPEQPLLVTGSSAVSDMQIHNAVNEDRLTGWETISIDQLALDMANQTMDISEIFIRGAYGRVLIKEDRTTNIKDLFIVTEQNTELEEKAADAAEEAGLAVNISRINIENASTDFSDLSLPLPFSTTITNMNGSITSLSTASTEPADISLQGDVDTYGLAEVSGQVMLRDPTSLLDMNVLFRNVELPNMTPYTIEFVGQEIDSGKLELNLRYQIENSQLLGDNSILIDELVLGDKVESPNALDLPLGLAVALLKKPDGTIDIDLEVSGDVNDPQFNIGAVVWDVFVNLITRAVTAPFNLLAGLVGADSEDFGEIEFRPGESSLAAPEIEKLEKLAEALALRPELVVEVPGVLDAEADTQAIKQQRISDEIERRLDEDGDSETILRTRQRRILETLASERLGVDLQALQAEFSSLLNPDEPDGEQVLDELAYVAAIEERLIENEAVSEQDLQLLANDRSAAIRAALLLNGEVEDARIQAAENETAEVNETGWVPVELSLAAQ